MWGQAFIKMKLPLICRIIPTRVGTSEGREPKPSSKEDHPHACGDKLPKRHCIIFNTRSSPRVWGQALATSSSSYGRGIIPTRVGTSTHLRAKSLSAQDHPHACGDKQLATCFTTLTLGSSPRVWGQVRCAAAILRVERIIPTRVGTRTADYSSDALSRDHPHACGDKLS